MTKRLEHASVGSGPITPKAKLRAFLYSLVTSNVIHRNLPYRASHSRGGDERRLTHAREMEKEKHQLIDRLRKEAEDLFKAGKLVEPQEFNARKRYEQLLELDLSQASLGRSARRELASFGAARTG